jgi:Sulfotransferase domain
LQPTVGRGVVGSLGSSRVVHNNRIRERRMRVIGAGLPRTATLSQKLAFEILGLGPCYHMVDVLSDLDRVPAWMDALDGDANWHRIFENYESTVDWPGGYFYRELFDEYPTAKVVLSVRSGESWARSMEQTICAILYTETLMRDLSSARGRVDPGWARYIDFMKMMWRRSGIVPDERTVDSASLAAAMERYNDDVKASTDNLLVWTATDGWGPLCEFLELPVPDVPFPHVNDAKMFTGRIVDSAIGALAAWRNGNGAAAIG